MHDTFTRRVVAGIDGMAGSRPAVDLAAGEAALRRLPLLLVAADAAPARARPGHGDPALTTTLRRLCTAWPGLTVATVVTRRALAEVLIEESVGAALAVVTRPGGARPRSSGYSEVAARAWCPTLVAPPTVPVSVEGPVLLGLTTSAPDEPAIAFAFEEAALRGVPLLAVHVWSGVPGTALEVINPFVYDLHQAQSAADRLVAEALAGWAEKFPDVRVQRMPLYDANRAQTLLHASVHAGLVVVGTDSTLPQRLGPVARTLVRHAECPVGVVRRTGHTPVLEPAPARRARGVGTAGG